MPNHIRAAFEKVGLQSRINSLLIEAKQQLLKFLTFHSVHFHLTQLFFFLFVSVCFFFLFFFLFFFFVFFYTGTCIHKYQEHIRTGGLSKSVYIYKSVRFETGRNLVARTAQQATNNRKFSGHPPRYRREKVCCRHHATGC